MAGTGVVPRPSPRWAVVVPAALVVVLAAYLVRRHLVGFRFPVPWPDEGSFLWQVLAFRDHTSLFAPEVNPEREVMWMPPGYLVLEGLLFKVLPFSLDLARTSSSLFICAAVTAVYAGLSRFEAKLVYPFCAALFLFCPIAHVAGNVARMEGLELAVISAGFLLLERRRLAGLGVLLVTPLIHPNGLFALAFGIGFLVYVVALRDTRRLLARPLDWTAIGGSLLCWILYGVHVARHFAAFTRDMEAQLRFKQFVSSEDGGPLARALEPVVWVPALVLAAAVVLPLRLRPQRPPRSGPSVFSAPPRSGPSVPPGPPLASLGASRGPPLASLGAVERLEQSSRRPGAIGVLAAALLAQTVVAAGWLYEVYPAFAVLVATAYAVDVFAPQDFRPAVLRTRSGALAAASLAVLVVFDACVFRHDKFLERSLERATVTRGSLTPAYLTDDDRSAVVRYLVSITPTDGERPLAVQFLPDAEGLVFERLRGPKLRYVQQTFYEHKYDVVLLHDSAWFPPFVRDLELLKLVVPKGEPELTVIRQREGTERWVAYRWR